MHSECVSVFFYLTYVQLELWKHSNPFKWCVMDQIAKEQPKCFVVNHALLMKLILTCARLFH